VIGFGSEPPPLPSSTLTRTKSSTSSVRILPQSMIFLYLLLSSFFLGLLMKLLTLHRSLHHTGDGSAPGEVSGAVVVDPSVASSGGLSSYAHASQDYGRSGREVYQHTQSLTAEGQGRPSSNQTMYNPSASGSSQYEPASAQSVDGPSGSVLSRLPSVGSTKQTPSPTASAG
jgi:hypothetical protein